MDPGDWFFYGILALSAIGSVVKASKKKEQSSDRKELSGKPEEPSGKWLKEVMEDAIGMGNEDEYIPKNLQPAVPQQPVKDGMTQVPGNGRMPETRANHEPYRHANPILEDYRRLVVSHETFNRPEQSLEIIPEKEGFESRHPVHPVETTSELVEEGDLNPAEDLADLENLKKAIIYGEIMHTKF